MQLLRGRHQHIAVGWETHFRRREAWEPPHILPDPRHFLINLTVLAGLSGKRLQPSGGVGMLIPGVDLDDS